MPRDALTLRVLGRPWIEREGVGSSSDDLLLVILLNLLVARVTVNQDLFFDTLMYHSMSYWPLDVFVIHVSSLELVWIKSWSFIRQHLPVAVSRLSRWLSLKLVDALR